MHPNPDAFSRADTVLNMVSLRMPLKGGDPGEHRPGENLDVALAGLKVVAEAIRDMKPADPRREDLWKRFMKLLTEVPPKGSRVTVLWTMIPPEVVLDPVKYGFEVPKDPGLAASAG